ncbi:MAG TPA: glycerophosphodiester phosphodiesterase family protein [Caldilineaceae bacterium]|nr:glycerophosphodiester phosphodiesterase family protein [Caldilineaceae bacterium]
MLPIEVPPHFRIIAHRGASAYAPENTAPAFTLAQRMGVTEVELDTQLTVDGEIVLCHDGTLARYGHSTQVVERLRWEELAALDMGAWFSPFLYGGTRMMTLRDLLAGYGDSFVYHVELKGKASGLPAAVHAAIRAHRLWDRCIITSFRFEALAAMRQINATARLGWLVREIDAETIAKARDLALFQLCPFAGTVTPAQVAAARQVTPEVRAWGLNGETVAGQAAEVITLIRRVLEAGCDGMTINWPDWVRHAAGEGASSGSMGPGLADN